MAVAGVITMASARLPAVNGELRELAERTARSVVRIRGRHGAHGSGSIWDRAGGIVTNAHVAVQPELDVETPDGRQSRARLVARDAHLDLAALHVDVDDLHPLEIGDSRAVKVGQLVAAMGNPFGLTNALTLGVVHGAPSANHMGMLRTDLRLAPGYSGGPMIDMSGRLLGINTMVAGGLGLAVPANTVERFLRYTSRPKVGVGLRVVRVVTPAGDQRSALLVTEVAADGRADRSGVLVGDVLLEASERRLTEPEDLAEAVIAGRGAVRLRLLRGGRPTIIELQSDVPDATHEGRAA